MIVKPGTFRLKRSLANQVARIFANGQDGFWYDPLLQYLKKESTGVTDVSAAEDPIGLWIDRSKGAGLGAELVTLAADREFTSDTGYWSKGAGWSVGSGLASITVSASTNAISRSLGTTGKLFQITYTIASVGAQGFTAYCGGTLGPVHTSAGTYTVRLVCGTTNTLIGIAASAAGTTGTIDSISIKLQDGNHSIQATAPARPTYRLDSGLPYAAALGTDDSVTSATGGGGTAGFCYVAALKPTGGAGTLRTLWSDTGTNTGRKVQIDTNNKLSFSAGNGTAFTTLASTATLDVGTKYFVTVRDNGTNLSVQINTAAAETVGRPVVAAGTAGFTQFKDNGAASSFLIADVYHVDGANNSALTDSQVASLQAYARSRIGL